MCAADLWRPAPGMGLLDDTPGMDGPRARLSPVSQRLAALHAYHRYGVDDASGRGVTGRIQVPNAVGARNIHFARNVVGSVKVLSF